MQAGNLNISIVDPLYLRYMHVNDYFFNGEDKFSDIDLYNQPDEPGYFPSFNYSRVLHQELKPGD